MDSDEERAKILEGKKLSQISKVALSSGRTTILEDEHRVDKFLKWLPAGPISEGGHREHDLVKFVAHHGGIRVVRAADLIII